MGQLDHAEWKRWCEDWKGVDFGAYPDFKRWQNTSVQAEQETALTDVLNQAKSAGDVKMARAVYRHAPYGSTVKRNALNFVLAHARQTSDKLLARDVYQHAGDTGLSQTALDAYKDITGEALTQ